MTFYSAAAIGLILVVLVIRKYRRAPIAAAPAAEVDAALLDRYHGEIEKETEKLDR
jgi:hypothetical protein